jgi:hypothetical protein
MKDVKKTNVERENSSKRMRRRKRNMNKYVFVVIVRFGQIASCRYFGERVGFHMINAICCFLRIIRYHTTHEKSLLYRMIQAVLAQRPTASS